MSIFILIDFLKNLFPLRFHSQKFIERIKAKYDIKFLFIHVHLHINKWKKHIASDSKNN